MRPARRSSSNTHGGPRTALFSFARETERKAAERYSGRNLEWREARFSLIDEVIEYRRTGVLTPSLLDACEAEFAVSKWPYSEGVVRLVQLACDGHAAARSRIDALIVSKDWRVRFQALYTSFERDGDPVRRRALLRLGLADRSSRIRSAIATKATFAHLIDMVGEIEQAALAETKDKDAARLMWLALTLRYNERSGRRNELGGEGPMPEDGARALAALRAKVTPAPAPPAPPAA